jgi:hypothetical protein
MLTQKESQKFWSRVQIVEGDGCWLWTAGKTGSGYGAIRMHGRQCLSHRIAFEDAYADVPPGLKVLHTCDNPPCVRPDHLWLGTSKDNTDDMCAKGRNAFGEDHPIAKLKCQDVENIRAMRAAGVSANAISEWYGVPYSSVAAIIDNRYWNHVGHETDKSINTKAKGSAINTAKLTEEQIPVIRNLHAQGWPSGMIASQFGVHKNTITRILQGIGWKHV